MSALRPLVLTVILVASAFSISVAAEVDCKVCVRSFQSPQYPPIARQARIKGEVTAEFTLNSDGKVRKASASTGHPLLMQAVTEALQGWWFECNPFTCAEGKKVLVTFEFKLTDTESESSCPQVTLSQPPIRVVIAAPKSPSHAHNLEVVGPGP